MTEQTVYGLLIRRGPAIANAPVGSNRVSEVLHDVCDEFFRFRWLFDMDSYYS